MHVATVRSVLPVRREICLTPLPGQEHSLNSEIEWLWLEAGVKGRIAKHRVMAWKGTEDVPVAILGPGTPRDIVATFKGAKIFVAEEDLLEPETTWNNLSDWIGLAVMDDSGKSLGTVVQTFATSLNAAVQVEQVDGRQFCFPVLDTTVLAIDLDKGEIIVGDLTPYRVDDED